MAEAKTKATKADFDQFIEAFVDSDKKKQDSYRLVEIFQEIIEEDAIMWGPSLIGFGSYHYKYTSGHEGDAPI